MQASTLTLEKITLRGANFNGVSSLPSISVPLRFATIDDGFELDEDDGLYLNYGDVYYIFPYKTQDQYDRTLENKNYTAVVLENTYLKAVFLPEFGGKLYSLYDKEAKRDLLFTNSVVRPCNLATRNAWMSGGVEWNCGYIGHNPFTCDLMHTARTKLEDGTPVLRFYQYERIRSVVYQLDFFLPEDSRLLYSRVRIINPQHHIVPMYWWSNIATPDVEGSRVIVPADTTYTSRDGHPVKIKIPVYNKIDVTYPLHNVIAIDYFWNIPEEERKFICIADKEGYGLIQASTKRLQGRKLFVWGNSSGGARWKNFLTDDNESGSYNEIQAGIAKTQYECLPMPPYTTWEWIEAYGAMHADPARIHASWDEAKQEVKNRLEALVTEKQLNLLLKQTKKMAQSPAEEMLLYADGWGALENKRREMTGERLICPYLDFGSVGAEQMPWLKLLTEGSLGECNPLDEPISYMSQPEWTALLEQSAAADPNNWFTLYQLGLAKFIEQDYQKAEELIEKSLRAEKSPWALYVLAVICRDTGRHAEETAYICEAFDMLPDNASLAKETLRSLYANEKTKETIEIYEQMPQNLQNIPRCRAYYAFALCKTGRYTEAEQLLYENGGLIVPDIRESETITYQLWAEIEAAKAAANGKTFDPATAVPPKFVDFRMYANIEWLNSGKEEQ